MDDPLAERQARPGANHQRQFLQRRVERYPLAAGEPLPAIKVVPAGLIFRQPRRALALAGLHDAGDEEIAAEQEVVALLEGLRVMLVIEEGRAQHRLIVSVRLPQQGVEVGQQAIAQLNRASNRRQDRRIHPRLVDRAIVVPGVDREARMHHPVLHPAHEQLGVRLITGEAADVVTDVIEAGEAHPQPHAGVVAKGIPIGAVIAAPGLHVALHPGAARA